jgi:hypothetical protein
MLVTTAPQWALPHWGAVSCLTDLRSAALNHVPIADAQTGSILWVYLDHSLGHRQVEPDGALWRPCVG